MSKSCSRLELGHWRTHSVDYQTETKVAVEPHTDAAIAPWARSMLPHLTTGVSRWKLHGTSRSRRLGAGAWPPIPPIFGCRRVSHGSVKSIWPEPFARPRTRPRTRQQASPEPLAATAIEGEVVMMSEAAAARGLTPAAARETALRLIEAAAQAERLAE